MSGITTTHISSPFTITIGARHVYGTPSVNIPLGNIYTRTLIKCFSVAEQLCSQWEVRQLAIPQICYLRCLTGLGWNQQPPGICQSMQGEKYEAPSPLQPSLVHVLVYNGAEKLKKQRGRTPAVWLKGF